MGAFHLTVHHPVAALGQLAAQVYKYGLGRIGFQREHGLAKKTATDGYAIETAHQLASRVPGFDGVGVSLSVQIDIGLLHVRSYPGAFRPRGATQAYHPPERPVCSDLEVLAVQGPAQASGYMDFVRKQYAAGVR